MIMMQVSKGCVLKRLGDIIIRGTAWLGLGIFGGILNLVKLIKLHIGIIQKKDAQMMLT